MVCSAVFYTNLILRIILHYVLVVTKNMEKVIVDLLI